MHANEQPSAQLAGLQHGAGVSCGGQASDGSRVDGVEHTVVAEVEAAVNPYTVLVDVDVLLGPSRPLAVDGNPFALQHMVSRGSNM
jgi:hypothetical protein